MEERANRDSGAIQPAGDVVGRRRMSGVSTAARDIVVNRPAHLLTPNAPRRTAMPQDRRRIIELLAEQPRSPSELAAAFDSCQSTVSEHLGVLRRASLAGFHELAGRRTYHLNRAALDEVAERAEAQRHRSR
jgi:DNA-binding transcriptional ArsR family regulator